MPPTTTDTHLLTLKTALENAKPPYCSGTLSVAEESLLLFYGNAKGETGRIDMGKATESELQRLSEACVPATFGQNQEDVLDLSYRKAGKLDEDCFAPKLDIERVGLMDVIRYGLLEGNQADKSVSAELYKLNVYGKGSFFKAHQDTPRGEKMFGSLVIVFPTDHEGGALIFRHGKKEWVFDSGRAIADKGSGSACLAYAAFFSDVEHEVTPVESGYRVTLTYNLYFKPKSETKIEHLREPQAGVETIPSDAAIFRTALSNLLANPEFLEDGGSIGFGLFHQYPIFEDAREVKGLSDCLKGRDAMIVQICKELSLQAGLWLLYTGNDETQILSQDTVEPYRIDEEEESFSSYALDNGQDARLVKHHEDYDPEEPRGYGGGWDAPSYDIAWVNEVLSRNVIESTYAAYGNEPSVGYSYGHVCLIVDIGRPGNRSKTVVSSYQSDRRRL